MAEKTSMSHDALIGAAKDLEGIITADRKQVFVDLEKMPMLAGNIDAGIWLQDRGYDRRAGLLQHVNDLQDAFAKLADKLRTIANKVSTTDSSNSNGLQVSAVDAINDWVTTLKNADRPKPKYERADYNSSDDRGQPTDEKFTYDDGGKKDDGHHFTVHADGAVSGTDFEADLFKDLVKVHPDFKPTTGVGVNGDVTVTDHEVGAHGAPADGPAAPIPDNSIQNNPIYNHDYHHDYPVTTP